MAASINDLLEMQKSQIDALHAVNQAAFNAAEKFLNLNLAAVKAAFQDATESGHALLAVKDAQELLALAGNAAQPSIEKAVSYSRHAYAIASEANAEFGKLFETQINEGNRKLADFIDFAAKNAPTGSEPAVSLLKSAVAAANTAIDTATKATRQASDWVETNFANATTATLQAATAAANDAAKPVKARKSA